MAQIWEASIGDDHYAIRTAGASIRLYRNGVNHSQWNPHRPFAGSIWDLLSLPAGWIPGPHPARALILGFGAGATARQIETVFDLKDITGIERDPVHLSIATGFFDVSPDCDLIQGDAVEWVEGAADAWDLIIDDLYGEDSVGIPVRNAPTDRDWFASLTHCLTDRGILVFNELEPDRVARHPILTDPDLRATFPTALCLSIHGYDNRALVFSKTTLPANCLPATIARILQAYPTCRRIRDRYQLTVIA